MASLPSRSDVNGSDPLIEIGTSFLVSSDAARSDTPTADDRVTHCNRTTDTVYSLTGLY